MYSYLTQPVITSLTISQKDADSFFSPTTLSHTGFAYDGFEYSQGAQVSSVVASWAAESPSDSRGSGVSFPVQALVLISAASITILDSTVTSTPIWMVFYLADTNSYAVNPLNNGNSYAAAESTWANGVLSVSFVPDAGTPLAPPYVLSVDFVQDQIYAAYRG